jgi:hypothetical protein
MDKKNNFLKFQKNLKTNKILFVMPIKICFMRRLPKENNHFNDHFNKIFLSPDEILKLNLDSLMNISDLKNEKDSLVSNLYGVLNNFYSTNSTQVQGLKQIHYKILVIGETSAGKDSSVSNLIGQNVGFISDKMSTMFPEYISKFYNNTEAYYFAAPGEEKIKYNSFKEMCEAREKAHKNLKNKNKFDFRIGYIEIHSMNKSTIPVSILNYPGFVNTQQFKEEGEDILKAINGQIKEMIEVGFGSVFIVRPCGTTSENETWQATLTGLIKDYGNKVNCLDFVVIHTKVTGKIGSMMNGQKTFILESGGYNNSFQYEIIEKFFGEHKLNNLKQFYIENWNHESDMFVKAKDDFNKFSEFLKENNDEFTKKFEELNKSYLSKFPSSNEINLDCVGIDPLRREYFQKISIPTQLQIRSLSSALGLGSSVIVDKLEEIENEIEKLQSERSKGMDLSEFFKYFSKEKNVVISNTSHIQDTPIDKTGIEGNSSSDELSESLFAEFQKIFKDKSDEVNQLFSSKKNRNKEKIIIFRGSANRLKKNISDLCNIIPFNNIDKEYIESASKMDDFSNIERKDDPFNQKLIKVVKESLKKLGSLVSKFLSNTLIKKILSYLDFVFSLDQFKHFSGTDFKDDFQSILEHLYGTEFQNCLSNEIEEFTNISIFSINQDLLDKLKKLEKMDQIQSNLSKNIIESIAKIANGNQMPQVVPEGLKSVLDLVLSLNDQSNSDLVLIFEENFRILLKHKFEQMWDTVVMNVFSKFRILNPDHAEDEAVYVKLLGFYKLKAEGVRGNLEKNRKFDCRELLNELKIEDSEYSFIPPIKLRENVGKGDLKGLLSPWMSSVYSLLTPPSDKIKVKLLEKINETYELNDKNNNILEKQIEDLNYESEKLLETKEKLKKIQKSIEDLFEV